MPDINLIKIEGKPIEKLIKVISAGIGTIYKPRAIRKEAEATAYKIGLIEHAKSKASVESKELEFEFHERLQERLLHKEIRRQSNIDSIAELAANELKDESSVSEEPVSEDWATRYFNIVEDISDEDMQAIWSRILAGEVKNPKSFSLRTLEFVKNLSKDEALSFVKVANLSVFSTGKNFVFDPDNGEFLKNNFDIKFTDILQLRELGLLNVNGNLQLSFDAPTKNDNIILLYHNKGIVLERKIGAPSQSMTALLFTSIGMQLLQLVQPTLELKYIQEIKTHLTSENTVVKFGDIFKLPDGQTAVKNIVDIPD